MKKFLTISAIFLFLTINALAEGEKITILTEDRVCEKDEDCTVVETNCEEVVEIRGCEKEECGCPDHPVNVKFKEKYKKLLEECRSVKKLPIHKPMGCRLPDIKCVENKCVFAFSGNQ